MDSGAAEVIKLTDAFADVVLAVQPPALNVVDGMKEGVILIPSASSLSD
jgi:hypothetical protein